MVVFLHSDVHSAVHCRSKDMSERSSALPVQETCLPGGHLVVKGRGKVPCVTLLCAALLLCARK